MCFYRAENLMLWDRSCLRYSVMILTTFSYRWSISSRHQGHLSCPIFCWAFSSLASTIIHWHIDGWGSEKGRVKSERGWPEERDHKDNQGQNLGLLAWNRPGMLTVTVYSPLRQDVSILSSLKTFDGGGCSLSLFASKHHRMHWLLPSQITKLFSAFVWCPQRTRVAPPQAQVLEAAPPVKESVMITDGTVMPFDGRMETGGTYAVGHASVSKSLDA